LTTAALSNITGQQQCCPPPPCQTSLANSYVVHRRPVKHHWPTAPLSTVAMSNITGQQLHCPPLPLKHHWPTAPLSAAALSNITGQQLYCQTTVLATIWPTAIYSHSTVCIQLSTGNQVEHTHSLHISQLVNICMVHSILERNCSISHCLVAITHFASAWLIAWFYVICIQSLWFRFYSIHAWTNYL
jgi:hypothetical protein